MLHDDLDSQQSLFMSASTPQIDLPNLPGIRKYGSGMDLSRRNWSRKSLRAQTANALQSVGPRSLSISCEDLDAFQSTFASLSPYPQEAASFDQLSGRYSLRAQTADRQAKNRALEPGFSSPIKTTSETTILRFIGFFEESIPNSNLEQFRIRRCFLNYYLEDGTIDIAEPKSSNSGLMQVKNQTAIQQVYCLTMTCTQGKISSPSSCPEIKESNRQRRV